MHIAVFGANGKVGRLVVEKALGHGHSVTAFVHSSSPFSHHPLLTVFKGNVLVVSDVQRSLQGADAVISTLSSWGTPTKNILTKGMQNIIPAMQEQNIRRIVSLTGADAQASGDALSRIHRLSHFGISILAGKVLRDGEEHIRLLQMSDLDWTVVRSPIMNELGNPKSYQLVTTRPLPWQTIHRASVAQCLVESVETTQHIQASPFITRH